MRFDIITIFSEIVDAYLGESIIKRARAKKLLEFRVHDLREYTQDKHHKVDDRPFGGGPGMVLKIEPMARAMDSILKSKVKSQKSKVKVVLFSAAGKQFTQKMARDWVKKYDNLVMIAGRYEGVDERIKKIVGNGLSLGDPPKGEKLEVDHLSIGPYVLTGGELPALVVADAVSRHIPGVLGKRESLEEKRHGIGVPVYTRPEVFQWHKKKYRVPQELLSGDHQKIAEWRRKHIRRVKP
mgnify:CR=1 FL=1